MHEHPFSSTISRKTLLGAVGVATIGALGKNVHDYNQGEQSAYFLEDTASKLTQERQLVTQYLQFKEGFQNEGHDMSQYSLWNATQHLGLIHALAETNKNPLVSPPDAFRTADSISTMHNEILDTPRPNYSENVENAEQTTKVTGFTAISAFLLDRLSQDIEKSQVAFPKKIKRRDLLQSAVYGLGTLNIFSSLTSFFSLPQHDMVNRAAYQNIPADILKQLTTQNGYADFINFYHNSLSALPNRASLQMMSGDEFYQAQYAKWQEVGIAWKNHTTQDQAKSINSKAYYLDNTTYESYVKRYQAVHKSVQKYQPVIRDAQPESPTLTYKSSNYSSVATMGAGLQILHIVRRNQPNLDFSLENPTIQ